MYRVALPSWERAALGALSAYDPLRDGPPTWYANGSGTAASQAEFELQAAAFRAALQRAGLTNDDGSNAVTYGPGLPESSDWRRAAAEIERAGRDPRADLAEHIQRVNDYAKANKLVSVGGPVSPAPPPPPPSLPLVTAGASGPPWVALALAGAVLAYFLGRR